MLTIHPSLYIYIYICNIEAITREKKKTGEFKQLRQIL